MTDKKWSNRCYGRIQQSHTEYALGGEGKQTNDSEWRGPR